MNGKTVDDMIEAYKIDEMIKGWFIGNFSPSLYKTNDVEVGIKQYKAGEFEAAHHHKIATEFTVIVSGEVEMNGTKYGNGDIIKINPGVSTDFKAITDTVTVVVKIPGANNDKYTD
jgi:quercetin dioxygenase-like cupin family protein